MLSLALTLAPEERPKGERGREGERERRESKVVNVVSGVSTQSLSTKNNHDSSSLIGWENPPCKSVDL